QEVALHQLAAAHDASDVQLIRQVMLEVHMEGALEGLPALLGGVEVQVPVLVAAGVAGHGAGRHLEGGDAHTPATRRGDARLGPPNNTTTARAPSNASRWRKRSDGLIPGVRWVQLVPSHSQVSL